MDTRESEKIFCKRIFYSQFFLEELESEREFFFTLNAICQNVKYSFIQIIKNEFHKIDERELRRR